MGFTVNDSLEIGGTGIVISRFYVSFGRETLKLTGAGPDRFLVECVAKIYKDKAAYRDGKAPLTTLVAKETIRENQLNGNLFKRLYNILKAQYTSTEDN